MAEPSSEPSPTQRPLPPSLEEQQDYYYGLPSCPKLVARSSTIPWSPQYDSWRKIPKSLYVVGEHAIVELWNDANSSLRRQIIQVIDKLDWTAIDVLRVGYAYHNARTGERFSRPVTILISVKTGLTFEQGYDVVAACSQILQSHNLDDVQVEMKESEVSRAASTPPQAPLPTPAVSTSSQATSSQLLQFSNQPLKRPIDATVLLSNYLGLSIAPSDSPRHEGTKCLYLQCGAKVFALTCRHVVFTNLHPNATYQHGDTTLPHTVMQPGNGTWAELVNSIPNHINSNKEYLDELEEKLNRRLLKGNTNQRELQTLIQLAKTKQNEYEASRETLAKWDNPASRIFGHVTFSPAYSLGPIQGTTEQRLRDWALIELHQEKHDAPLTSLVNMVYVGGVGPGVKKLTRGQLSRWRDVRESLAGDNYAALVEGIITETEMRFPQSSTVDDEKGFFVLKHGGATGLTTGITSQVKSLIRSPYSGGEYRSEEWCILGPGQGFGREAFSGDGDSGSCVFDTQGRVGGMLTGGLAREDFGNHDVSYVTPMEWLLEDIKRHGYDVELL